MIGSKKMNNNKRLGETKPKRLYVLVDETLDPIYGAVQGGHCVAQYMIDNKLNKDSWDNEYLIYLSANVGLWRCRLLSKGKKISEFREPDLENRLTSICCVDDGSTFKRLPLLHAKKY
jgi:hypothetical protein